jgi:membrane protease subunit (stomatin/prohibitin family)
VFEKPRVGVEQRHDVVLVNRQERKGTRFKDQVPMNDQGSNPNAQLAMRVHSH